MHQTTVIMTNYVLPTLMLIVRKTHPTYCPISQLVYAANRQQVTDVWIAGKRLLNQRQLTTMDMAELKNKISAWQVE
jgi:cytosine/adenosine deaminase-related metal-dependent hydrolase